MQIHTEEDYQEDKIASRFIEIEKLSIQYASKTDVGDGFTEMIISQAYEEGFKQSYPLKEIMLGQEGMLKYRDEIIIQLKKENNRLVLENKLLKVEGRITVSALNKKGTKSKLLLDNENLKETIKNLTFHLRENQLMFDELKNK